MHNQVHPESILCSNFSTNKSNLKSRRAMKSRQRTEDGISIIPPENCSYDAETAYWASNDADLSAELANVVGCDLHDEPLNPGSRSSCLIEARSSGVSDDQTGILTSALDSLKSSRAHAELSSVAKIKSDHKVRRREQNRRSQQAYRERRLQYALDLDSKVEAMAACVQRLELEKRELLRSLCVMSAKNKILRTSWRESEASSQSSASSDFGRSLDRTTSQACNPMSSQELEPLYEPFLALWNLLSSHLPSNSQPQDFAAALEHLLAMVISRTRRSGRDESTG